MLKPSRIWIAIGALSIASWILIIVFSGLGWNPFGAQWDFANTGAFGDSFGPLSACMAALAALSAIGALNAQRQEIARLRQREIAEDKRGHKADFERTFFQLLQALRDIVNSIDVEGSGTPKRGQDAFRSIVYTYNNSGGSSNPTGAWQRIYGKYRNDLGHYFRFLYHIIRYIDSDVDVDQYFYVQLTRASLSDSEFLLIALNCVYGEGSERFKPLIEKYALLHNISQEHRDTHRLQEAFESGAFERPMPVQAASQE